jgi:hypothetical protein
VGGKNTPEQRSLHEVVAVLTSRGTEKREAEEKIKAGAMPCFNVERFRGVQRLQARGSGAEVLPGRILVELANT